jgi:glycosyltransferase involved in cell wall biosynthesis
MDRPMRVLFLNYSTTNLATMIRSLELADGLAQCGHRVSLHYLHVGFRPPAFFLRHISSLSTDGLSIHHRGKPAIEAGNKSGGVAAKGAGRYLPSVGGILRRAAISLRYVPRELALIARERPDVVIARPDQVFSFVFSAAMGRIPLVLSTDGPVEELESLYGLRIGILKKIDAWRMHRAKAILYISTVCGNLLAAKGIARERLFCCPNGADPGFFKPLAPSKRARVRTMLGVEDNIVVGFSGNLVAYHGVGEFLASMVPLLRSDPRLKIVLIGAVKDEQALMLETLPADLRSGRVVVTGAVAYRRMPEHIDAADIMVMPYPAHTLFHFSPMKLFENLAMGKYVVASSQGQIHELLHGLETAFLYDPADPSGLHAALASALSAFKRNPHAATSRDFIVRSHTWQQRGAVVEAACRFAHAPAGASKATREMQVV